MKNTGRLRNKVWSPTFYGPCPRWQRAVSEVKVDIDLQTLTFKQLDYLFAVFASNGRVKFTVRCSGARLARWSESVAKRSRGAAERYETHMRAHFRRYKQNFVEGYSLPAPPTPELRVVYDSGTKSQAPLTHVRADGTNAIPERDGPICHWRTWPLATVRVQAK